jgi:hypothetical protein
MIVGANSPNKNSPRGFRRDTTGRNVNKPRRLPLSDFGPFLTLRED